MNDRDCTVVSGALSYGAFSVSDWLIARPVGPVSMADMRPFGFALSYFFSASVAMTCRSQSCNRGMKDGTTAQKVPPQLGR